MVPHCESQVLTARWVLPVEGEPLHQGTVTIAGERIVGVGRRGERSADLDLGNTALLPGLVNAHTHLDLTGLRGQLPTTPDFTGWLRGVIDYRRTRFSAEIQRDIQAGLEESLAHGTTLVGDISAGGLSWSPLSARGIGAVVFYELIGLSRDRARQAWAGARRWLADHPAQSGVTAGLSPHAPYSARRSLFRAAASCARRLGLCLQTHLAEAHSESELLQHRSGPFVRFLNELGVYDETALAHSQHDVLALAAAPHLSVAHGNYLGDVPANAAVIYCPRTHAAFGHATHPFQQLLSAGNCVALGTDSLASNPDLSILAETRFLHAKFPDVPGRALLSMATLAGARALGRAHETGSLVAGKLADLVAVPLPNHERADPHDLLFESDTRPSAVWCSGRPLLGRSAA